MFICGLDGFFGSMGAGPGSKFEGRARILPPRLISSRRIHPARSPPPSAEHGGDADGASIHLEHHVARFEAGLGGWAVFINLAQAAASGLIRHDGAGYKSAGLSAAVSAVVQRAGQLGPRIVKLRDRHVEFSTVESAMAV